MVQIFRYKLGPMTAYRKLIKKPNITRNFCGLHISMPSELVLPKDEMIWRETVMIVVCLSVTYLARCAAAQDIQVGCDSLGRLHPNFPLETVLFRRLLLNHHQIRQVILRVFSARQQRQIILVIDLRRRLPALILPEGRLPTTTSEPDFFSPDEVGSSDGPSIPPTLMERQISTPPPPTQSPPSTASLPSAAEVLQALFPVLGLYGSTKFLIQTPDFVLLFVLVNSISFKWHQYTGLYA